MPAGLPLALDPNRLMQVKQAAAQGDQQAMAILQSLQGGGGGPPQGGMPPPQQGGMTQSQFGNGGPVPPDVQAKRAQQLIELLRARQ